MIRVLLLFTRRRSDGFRSEPRRAVASGIGVRGFERSDFQRLYFELLREFVLGGHKLLAIHTAAIHGITKLQRGGKLTTRHQYVL
jgi:hypothetical protein